MPSTNDIVLAYKARSRVDTKIEIWQEALKSKSFWLNETKTKYIEFKFSKNKYRNDSYLPKQPRLQNLIL